jgi:hypothetical protein
MEIDDLYLFKLKNNFINKLSHLVFWFDVFIWVSAWISFIIISPIIYIIIPIYNYIFSI